MESENLAQSYLQSDEVKYIDMLSEAYRSAKVTLIRKWNIERLQILAENGAAPREIQIEYDILKKVRAKYQKKESRFFFITLNFKPESTIDEIKLVMDKILNRKYFINFVYGYDQRSGDMTTTGTGIHVHGVLKKEAGLKKNYIPKWLFNSCKNYMSDMSKIDVKIYDDKFYQDKIDYVKGIKFNEDKLEVAAVTKVWRQQNNLQDIYNLSN